MDSFCWMGSRTDGVKTFLTPLAKFWDAKTSFESINYEKMSVDQQECYEKYKSMIHSSSLGQIIQIV